MREQTEAAAEPARSEAIAELEAIFHPRAIAVVGASANPETQGHDYVRCLLEFGYGGAVYPVNPSIDEVLGLRAYPSLREVPGPVDYVISCIPAAAVLPLIEDCGHKRVRAVHFFTGRFSETGREDAAHLERELRERARKLGVRIIGPNCMGLYYPRQGITFRTNFPRDPGPVAFLSQSGGNAVELVYHGAQRGLRFSKVISYGNALDLDEVDFLDYFAQDEETRVVAAYIEGVRDGRRSLESLRRVAARKPVVVLKGGRTESGTRAAASHTAALAGAGRVWSAAVRQAGACEVSTLDDAIDMLVSFSFLRPGTGLRVGVVGGGGGRTVQSADICEEAGLTVVPLPPEIRHELRERVPEIWDWLSNPVDQSILGGFPIGATGLLQIMAQSPHFDVLIANVGEDWPLGRPGGDALVRHVAKRFAEIGREVSKPLAVVLGLPDSPDEQRWRTISEAQQTLVGAGLAVYPSSDRAARAVSRFVQYCCERQGGG